MNLLISKKFNLSDPIGSKTFEIIDKELKQFFPSCIKNEDSENIEIDLSKINDIDKNKLKFLQLIAPELIKNHHLLINFFNISLTEQEFHNIGKLLIQLAINSKNINFELYIKDQRFQS